MTTLAFVAVICAAILHATWNALVKGSTDKTASMGAVVLGHVPLAGLAFLFAPAPDPAAYAYLLTGIALHFGYQVFLLNSYQLGDLSLVYPIARGSAPLIVALVSVSVLGVRLSSMETVSILMIAIGIISLGLVRKTDGGGGQTRASVLALITGLFIAAYSLIDGLGARLAGTSLGFYSWLAIGNGLVMTAYLAIRSPASFRAIATTGRAVFIVGGSASFLAYALVTWAFTQAPIALVTALRETSIVFALMIGVFILREKISLGKVLSTFLTLLGAILLRFAKQ